MTEQTCTIEGVSEPLNTIDSHQECQGEIRTVSGDVFTPPPTPKINLSTAEEIKREMARVYRDARGGRIDTSEAGKLAYILTAILKAHELHTLETRLNDLEAVTVQNRRIK